MYIEQIFPEVVGGKSILLDLLEVEATERNIPDVGAFIASVPKPLRDAPAFLDKMTNLWRYEFGIPYELGEELVWGTHMWGPVHCLFIALSCAHLRLPEEIRGAYLKRLANPKKHQATLVEMIPCSRVNVDIAIEFEVPGQGVGNRTIDWLIGPHEGRVVLMEVKRRTLDFISLMARLDGEAVDPQPSHNPELLFRSVEGKFVSADPSVSLQGVWVVTDVKQDDKAVSAAFVALDSTKVHFAILGDWKKDAHVLVRRREDEKYLRDLFHG